MTVVADRFIPMSLLDISNQFYDLGKACASLNSLIGSIDSLSTEAKANLVVAINEVFSKIGALTSLPTSANDNLVAAINEIFAYTKVLKEGSGSGLHNSLFRGKNLGSSLTSEQSSAIRAGTFDDLWIGDFWVIGGVTYRIADFDYYLHSGDTECTTHHVVVVPDTVLYTAAMNSTDTTAGGYVGSKMYSTYLRQAETMFKSCFGEGHVLTHREHLVNAVTNGRASAGAWYDRLVDIMDERMVYGSLIYDSASTDGGSSIPNRYSVSCKQLNLFRYRPDLIGIRQYYWLRNVVSGAHFAFVHNYGHSSSYLATSSNGVRPTALIY